MKKMYFLFFLLFPFLLEAKSKLTSNELRSINNTSLLFIENKGQITDQFGKTRLDIQYAVSSKDGLNVFIGKGGIHYQFSNIPNTYLDRQTGLAVIPCKKDVSQCDMYRMDVTLVDANLNARMIADEQHGYYEIYHTGYVGGNDMLINSFKRITYKDIYPNIDWVLYFKQDHLEYDFVVRPGGNIKNIKLRYDGTTEIQQLDNNIKALTPMGQVSEGKLYCYEQKSGKEISSKFELNNNILSFDVETNNRETVVIDPTLIWGTYFGGSSQDYGQSITCDNLGNVYVAGFTSSISHIATSGAYQYTYGGAPGAGGDAFLSKFNSSGAIQWTTYYGGNGNDGGWGVALDDTGNVYMSGYTASATSIATAGSHQSTLGGNFDVFIAKFTNAGMLKWATYYGGSGSDYPYGIVCDHSGNVYISGQTSSVDSIATTGSYQSINGGLDDGFLAKFNGNGNLTWATYYGGSNTDRANGLTIDDVGNLYVTGTTLSSNSISTVGSHQSTFGGGMDAFICKFSNGGGLIWASYYGGSGQDGAYDITFDGLGNLYIFGITSSIDSIATVGAHQVVYGGGSSDAFLAKFNTSGILQWGTYYGGNAFEQGLKITSNAGVVYVTGGTQSTSSIATTDGYQSTIGGYDDAFLAQFSSVGSLIWATYYGGTGGDQGQGIVVYNKDVYLTGSTYSTTNIATTGSYQNIFGGGATDCFIAKFSNLITEIQPTNGNASFIEIYPNPASAKLAIRPRTTSKQ